MVARLVAQKLSVALGQSVLVENRAGESGGIAAQSVARSPPGRAHDPGGTECGEIAINPHWVKNIPYNPEKDLLPIALGVIVPLGLVVPAKAPYADPKELVDAARSSQAGSLVRVGRHRVHQAISPASSSSWRTRKGNFCHMCRTRVRDRP